MDEPAVPQGNNLSAEEWEVVKDLVYEGQLQNPHHLGTWLDEQSASGPVREEAERLLRSASTCGDFLQRTAADQFFGVSRKLPEKIGPYRVLEVIGSGGMGVVYAAHDEKLNRRVAIKVLQPHTAEDPEQRKRLRWDAQAACALQHPNIVTVFEVGTEDGSDYVVMECISGKTLGRLIPKAGLDLETALHYAIQIASGLEAAHQKGIVHRDLKPGNIMVTDSGTVKLLDFGLAKGLAAGLQSGDSPRTIEGTFAGTVAYVSPEQAEGKPVDVRSDVFSFGSVLFEMVTGRRAFPGNNSISVLANILHIDPAKVGDLHPRSDSQLDEVVQRCLRKDRERRFQTIGEVRVRLEEIREELQYARQDRSAVHAAAAPPTSRRQLLQGILIGAAAASLAAGLLVWSLRSNDAGPRNNATLVQETSNTGVTEYPAISRDGQFLAYASDRVGNGNLNLWVQMKGSDPVQRTFDSAGVSELAFSPDGRHLVFRSDREGGGLYLTPTFSGEEHSIGVDGHDGQFSPDGKWIAYWTGREGASFYRGSAQLWLVPTTGGEARKFLPEFAAAAHPIWSPEGDRLLFLGRQTDQKATAEQIDWWVASIDGKRIQRTYALPALLKAGLGPPFGSYYSMATVWLRTGSRVLFSARTGDTTNLWAISLNERGKAIGVPAPWTHGTTVDLHPSAAEVDGLASVAFAAKTVSHGIWRIPLNAQGEAAGAPEEVITGYDRLASSSISRDGSRIAFSSQRPEAQLLRFRDLSSGADHLAASVPVHHVTRPVLSGDGKTLAWWDEKAIYLRHLPAGATEKICDICGPPSHVSFDGSSVLFEGPGQTEEAVVYRRGEAPRRLFEWADGSKSHPGQAGVRYSPDERMVTFYGSRDSSSAAHIWTAPVRKTGGVQDQELNQITDGERADGEPVWSVDGRTIYFLSERDGFKCIWARHVDPATGRPVGPEFAVQHFHRASQNLQTLSAYSGDIGLAASRDSLIFVLASYRSNIWRETEHGPPGSSR